MEREIRIRLARSDEIAALNALIDASARALSRGFYTGTEIEALCRFVFGVDSGLIEDGTYFVAELDGERAACGGWSRRRTLYGGDQRPVGEAARLDPKVDAARIRAFFVSPDFARRGLGRALLEACERAALEDGFQTLELMATLPGVPFYDALGFSAVEEARDTLPNGVEVRFVRMRKPIDAV